MKLEQQVCSLDLAKRLKKLGVRQESLYCWKHNTMSEHGPIDSWVVSQFPGLITSDYFVAAFTVAELGEMLPDAMSLTRRAVNGQWAYPDMQGVRKYAATEADARAKMLIYLLENKLITL